MTSKAELDKIMREAIAEKPERNPASDYPEFLDQIDRLHDLAEFDDVDGLDLEALELAEFYANIEV